MKIGIDIRSLQDATTRGVSQYTHNLINALLKQNKANDFNFFTTGRNKKTLLFPNQIHLPIPSKIINIGMRFFGSPTIDGQLNTKNIFMPNLGFWSVGPNTKLTLTVHDLSFLINPSWYSLRDRLWHKAINVKGLLKRADKIITLSAYTKQEIIDLLDISTDKIFHIPPGIPVLPTPSENLFSFPYILFIGALDKRKNLKGALCVFEKVAKKLPNTHFVLAGPSTNQKQISRLMSGHEEIMERVHFLGHVTDQKKSTLIKHAQALFMPSFHEGFGFPPLEAMTLGTPVVAAGSGALPETIGSAGLLLDSYDIGGFSDALIEICENTVLREQIIARGHEQIKRFSWDLCAEKTLKVILS